MSTILTGIIRAGLAALAGWLASKGLLNPEDVNTVASAILVVLVAFWSAKNKIDQKKEVDAALNSAPPGMRIVIADKVVPETTVKPERYNPPAADG